MRIARATPIPSVAASSMQRREFAASGLRERAAFVYNEGHQVVPPLLRSCVIPGGPAGNPC
jgi:hypothetical protein